MSHQLTDTVTAPAAEQTAAADPRVELEKRFKSGASWFYWVAGLSLVNSVVALFGGEWGFIFGLGITQMVDAAVAVLAEETVETTNIVRVVGLAVNAGVVGVVALMGWLARRGHRWVFVVGLVLYAGDALLFVLVGDWLGLAFHGWVLFAVTSGYLACRQLAALDAERSPQLSPA